MSMVEVREVPKPWGKERWFAYNSHYAGKLLVLNPGQRLSLQYHKKKHETQFVMYGKLRYTIGYLAITGEVLDLHETLLRAGDAIELAPGTVHRVEAIEAACILEVSTPELEDVVRLEDDYGRASSAAAVEQGATPPDEAAFSSSYASD